LLVSKKKNHDSSRTCAAEMLGLADVVVIGAGVSGLAAAITVRDSGGSVAAAPSIRTLTACVDVTAEAIVTCGGRNPGGSHARIVGRRCVCGVHLHSSEPQHDAPGDDAAILSGGSGGLGAHDSVSPLDVSEGFVPLPLAAQHRNRSTNGWGCAPKQCSAVAKTVADH
jgi:hypothetical protein